jgi:glutaminyl-tRNA synthetase
MAKPNPEALSPAPAPTNFLRTIIERDLAEGRCSQRHFGGSPGDAAHHAAGPLDPARIRTRFPPEPNGYLHIGHAKSICLNFGLARDFGGVCHLRFDDTNPEKEEQEYVDAIIEMVHWLGFDWQVGERSHLYYASNYFDFMYRAAEFLIEAGLAYVDEQSADEMRINRGDFGRPGVASVYRDRTPAQNLARFREMRDGQHGDGTMVLRARIDLAAPNINLRDPAIYRIRHASHHNTGDKWCIYPMYTFAHPIEDALEQITHSICTLEFEDQRPFYDWLLERLSEPVTLADGRVIGALLARPLPRQYEFARLNITGIVTSKRKLRALVEAGRVAGWDDPRMPTLAGLRRRGYTPESLRLLAERTGASKANSVIEYEWLDIALRDDLETKAPRAFAVLSPLKLELVNWAEAFGSAEHREPCSAPAHPNQPELGQRSFSLGPAVWIEADDFAIDPPKGYFRFFPPRTDASGALLPGSKVRLKYGVIVECTGYRLRDDGSVEAVQAVVIADTKSGTPGASLVKVKGTIGWVGAHEAVATEIRLYERLLNDEAPAGEGADSDAAAINPDSLRIIQGWVEPGAALVAAQTRLQFERHGYFVADRIDHGPGRPVFNRITGLKDGKGR